MEVTSAASQNVSATAAPGSPDPLQDALLRIYNRLTGERRNSAELSNAHPTEDLLYAALVYKELKEKSPAVAGRMLSEIKTRFDRRTDRHDSQPLFRVVDDILNNAVRARQLTEQGKQRIVRQCFGEAQLDSRQAALNRRPAAVSPSSGENTMAAVENRVAANHAATKTQLSTFRDRIEQHRWLSHRTADAQRSALNRVFSDTASSSPQTPPTSPPPSTPSPSREAETPGELPRASVENTTPDDLVYTPASESDGKVLVILPRLYSDRTIAVSLMNESGDEIEKLAYSGNGQRDGLAHFRGKRAGAELGDTQLSLRLWLLNGTHVDQILGDPRKVSVRFYRWE